MAANSSFSGTGDDTLEFDRPVNYLLVSVATGVTFSLSLDKLTYMTLPAGFHSFHVGPVNEVMVKSSGAWQLTGVQA